MSEKRFRDDDGKLDLGKIKRYEDSSYKIVLLLKYIKEQQDTIQSLKEENEQLRTRLQDVLAELYCKDRKLEELGISIECCDGV